MKIIRRRIFTRFMPSSRRSAAPSSFTAPIGRLMILRIVKAKVCGPFALDLTFNDDTRKCVNVKPLLRGPIFRPLKDADYFKAVRLDRVCGTVCWPNRADFAPEALHALKPARVKK
jgi:hypothetical protein